MQVNTDAASKSLTNATYQQLLLSHLQEGRNHMDNQETHRYDDIINLPHPTSKTHPRMPFAALTGHDAAIAETARRTDEKHQLSEDTIAELNEKLNLIAETIGTKQTVTITYFVPDLKKSGGSYVTCTGVVRKIDTYNHALIMEDNTIIELEQISDIEGRMFG